VIPCDNFDRFRMSSSHFMLSLSACMLCILGYATANVVSGVDSTSWCNASDYGVKEFVPCVKVKQCGIHPRSAVSIAQQADGKAAFPAETNVQLCHTSEELRLSYTAQDEELFLNHYDKCNTDMWNNEVVEIFIAPAKGGELITRYHEVECSPHNALYVAEIHNPYGNGTDKSNKLIPCASSGVSHNVSLDKPGKTWSTDLAVPWTLVGSNGNDLPKIWRVNLFRVLMLNESSPICDDDQCRYGAWNPTNVYPSNYHHTTALGVVVLE